MRPRGATAEWAALLVIGACSGPPGLTRATDAAQLPGDAGLPDTAIPLPDAVPLIPVEFGDETLGAGLPNTVVDCLIFEDFDDDGLPDLLAAVNSDGIWLYRNRGDGTFVPLRITEPLTFADDCVAGDFDEDGKMDVAIATGSDQIRLFRGIGDGRFQDVSNRVPSLSAKTTAGVHRVAFLDYDGDGRLDLLATYFPRGFVAVGELVCDFIADGDIRCDALPNEVMVAPQLLHNDGAAFSIVPGAFAASDARGVNALATVDWDQDGYVDIFASIDFEVNALWRNVDGTGVFEDILPALGAGEYNHGMGAAIADFDEDGVLDIYVADLGANQLWLSRDGLLENHAVATGIADATRLTSSWSPVAADFDRDGHLDIFLVLTLLELTEEMFMNGLRMDVLLESDVVQRDLLFARFGATYKLQEFLRPGTFPTVGQGASAVADYDFDGDLDLFEAYAWPRESRLLVNNSPSTGHWLQVRLEPFGSARTDAALVELQACGRRQLRLSTSAPGGVGHGTRTVHFGLGPCAVIERVSVTWPGGNVTDAPGTLTIDSLLVVTRPG